MTLSLWSPWLLAIDECTLHELIWSCVCSWLLLHPLAMNSTNQLLLEESSISFPCPACILVIFRFFPDLFCPPMCSGCLTSFGAPKFWLYGRRKKKFPLSTCSIPFLILLNSYNSSPVFIFLYWHVPNLLVALFILCFSSYWDTKFFHLSSACIWSKASAQAPLKNLWIKSVASDVWLLLLLQQLGSPQELPALPPPTLGVAPPLQWCWS